MTLKELKELIKGKRIDRIAGFCDSYEQMIDRCRLDVHNGSGVIDTSDDGDNDNHRLLKLCGIGYSFECRYTNGPKLSG